MTGAEGAIPGQNRWHSREFRVLVVLVDDVPGSDHARERRKQEQNRQRAAGHERKSGGTIGECPDLRFGTLPPIDAVESPADERDDEIHKNKSTPGKWRGKNHEEGGLLGARRRRKSLTSSEMPLITTGSS